MSHVLDAPGELTDRARRFLSARGRAVPFPTVENPDDAQVAERLARFPGVDKDVFLARLRPAQARYGGLVYRTSAWSFEEEIRFQPWPAYGASVEHGPLGKFIDHTVAHPYTVTLRGDGAVVYRFGRDVAVFPDADTLIEADALYWECESWIPVVEPKPGQSQAGVREAASLLTPIPEGSGHTEWWWESDGFRVHVWHTFAELFEQERLAKWGLWARDEAGVRAAHRFLSGLPVRVDGTS
ncbi:hypothetical protein [Streptomyces lavendulae]|uniref:hypothetical protein n=1 Tax=Streptomyces lavendulae TaxID=1914 RepID=UPI0024A5228E|nr:hypothetical protein [Streptomyces lavendulae]GLX18892.1 hypothetical protein Slala01_25360 [Streptomyces lavendulae subsp. lavendulae]GLX29186.1 hypothetical protein Slala02_50060 [Streptomyces lavendulae subsp. lavendulae]